MKKYWKSISIAVITVAAIGFFYIQSALAGVNYPEYKIKTLSGNEEELEDLILYGDYREGNIKGDNFQITAEGIEYNGEASYFDRLRTGFGFPEINQYQKKYKHFMRGKQSIFQLAENEHHLVHASVNSETESGMVLQIEVLDKDSNHTMEFTVDVPDNEKYSSVYIEQIYIAEEEVSVVTRNHVNGSIDSFSTEIHMYDIDIGEESLVNDEMVVSYSEGSGGRNMTNVFTPGNGSTLQSNSHAIFIIEQWERDENDEEGYYSQFAESKVTSINVETNEVSEFELPDELKDISHSVLLEDSTLYFTNQVENGLEITVYDLENQKLDENRSFTIERDNMNMGSQVTAIKDGRLYIASQINESYAPANILVIDVQSGELVYEGQITGENGDMNPIGQSFHLFNMTVH
ncbi:hypothetical protein ACDX78_12135 [Virgibacillus oceani]